VRRLRTWSVRLLRALAVGLALLVVGRLCGLERGTWPSAAMVALPIWLAASYPLLLASVALRQRALSWAALALTAAHVLVVAPHTGRDAGACTGTPLRVVTANVLKFNAVPEQAARVLLALRPDVLVMPETTFPLESTLDAAGALTALPHRVADPSREFDTTMLRSRFPITEQELRPVEGFAEPRGTVLVGDVPVRLLGVHPQPPIDGQGAGWQRALQDLDGELQRVDGAAVAAGDFNGSRDLKSFRRLLDDGVRDAHEELGRGLAPTWPATSALPPFLHLDHVLVKGGVSVCDVDEVRVPGSDHLAVVADLAVRP